MPNRNIRFTDELDKKIKSSAELGKVSYNEVVRLCCEAVIDVVHDDFKRRKELFAEAAKKYKSQNRLQ